MGCQDRPFLNQITSGSVRPEADNEGAEIKSLHRASRPFIGPILKGQAKGLAAEKQRINVPMA